MVKCVEANLQQRGQIPQAKMLNIDFLAVPIYPIWKVLTFFLHFNQLLFENQLEF